MQIYNRTTRQRMRYVLRLMRSERISQMDVWSAVTGLTFVLVLLLNGGR